MVSLTSLVSYWKLDEASGTRNDAHGTNHLTDNNTVGSATGKINNGADFESSSSEYLSCASNSTLQMGDIDFTITAWVKMETVGNGMIVTKDDESSSSSREYVLDYWGTSFRFYFVDTSSTVHITTVSYTPAVGEWVFVVGWHDATTNNVWIQINNGTPVANTTGGAAPPTSSSQFRIGAREYSGAENYFDGVIDEVSLWKRLLTAPEKTDLYNGGAGLAYPFGGSTTAYKDANVRTRLAVGAFKDAATRTRIAGRAFKDASARLALRAGAFKDAASRFGLRVGAFKDAGVRFVLALGNQIARPTADVSNDNWTNELGATTGLYASIDEVTASDADYIQSSPSPATWEEYKTRLGDLVDPAVTTGHTIRVQYKKSATGGDRIDLMVSLYRADGITLITQQGFANIDALTTVDINLSGVNADDIPYADYPDLVIGLAAINNTGGGGVPPWL